MTSIPEHCSTFLYCLVACRGENLKTYHPSFHPFPSPHARPVTLQSELLVERFCGAVGSEELGSCDQFLQQNRLYEYTIIYVSILYQHSGLHGKIADY